MKFIKSYKIFESIDKKLSKKLEKYGIENYIINSNGSIDCNQDVAITSNKIIFNFNRINGKFDISCGKLLSLKNCPNYINNDFDCSFNELISLENGPEYVGNDYLCYHNKLTTLKGCIEEVYGGFYCHNNKLTSLEFCPMDVNGNFHCSNNKLEYLDRSPLIKGNLDCRGMFKTKPEFNGHCEELIWK